MESTKKYIITELKKDIVEAPWTNRVIPRAGNGKGGRVLWIDDDVMPGSFYVETAWAFPMAEETKPESVASPHKHDHDEVLCLFGTDPQDPYDLCGEVEFWLGGEKHILTKSCIIFIPKGMEHCPLIYHRVDRPIFNFTTHHGKMYY